VWGWNEVFTAAWVGESDMGTVIRFPALGRDARERKPDGKNATSATVVILPVIRIERYDDVRDMEANGNQRRRRRRRAAVI
jgi:hypothetical protein